jgi:hypothetical protein
MTQDAFTPFEMLREVLPDEVVTHSQVQDVTLPSGKSIALITLDNEQDLAAPPPLARRP